MLRERVLLGLRQYLQPEFGFPQQFTAPLPGYLTPESLQRQTEHDLSLGENLGPDHFSGQGQDPVEVADRSIIRLSIITKFGPEHEGSDEISILRGPPCVEPLDHA